MYNVAHDAVLTLGEFGYNYYPTPEQYKGGSTMSIYELLDATCNPVKSFPLKATSGDP